MKDLLRTLDSVSFLKRSVLFSFLFCLALQQPFFAQNSSLVWMDNGSLSYGTFAAEQQTNQVNTIPDFSYAGYMGGGVAIPTAPVKVTLSASGSNDTQAIQSAIDQVEAMPLDGNGFRGAVLLTAGCYEVDQLTIEASGVVLRGEGQGIDGTVLYAALAVKHDFITVQGSGSGISLVGSGQQTITDAYVPVGTHSFSVNDASAYSQGDMIVIRRTPNQFWIDDLGMDEATLCADDPGDCGGWTPSSYEINHLRTITNISSNTITVDLPIVDIMEAQYGGGEIYPASVPGRIEQCGVENLRIESYYDPANTEDENHAWIGVHLKRVINSWVANVTGQHLGYGTVSISSESDFNTVQECATVDPISAISGGRRYSFNISDGVGNLFQRCYTRGGRHDFVTGSRVTGPNVFLDCYSANTHSDIGPHHRWATGLLFDNIRGGQIQVRNRGSSGSGHGWSGNTTMFWNLLSYQEQIKVDSPKGGINWGIGCVGVLQEGAGFWESWNSNVLPRSLYLQQLQDRLGASAVSNITIPAQLSGNIYGLLESWAGEYDFGVPSGTLAKYATEDAYVRGGTHVNTNYGSDDDLIIKENSGSADNDRMSFLKFNLSDISGPIYNVKLRLYVSNDAPSAAQNSLHFVSDDTWNENTITWTTQPGPTNLLDTKAVPDDGLWLEYDITSIVNTELNGDGVLSLRLSEATTDNFYAFSSKDENGTGFDPHFTYTLSSQAPPEASCSDVALPVDWQSFDVRKEEKSAILHWSTSNEINHDYFISEWSTDGRNFTELGKVTEPQGQQAFGSLYTYRHLNPRIGVNYYRIKQVDLDGSTSYSSIKSLHFEGAHLQQAFTVHPNPTQSSVQVSLSANQEAKLIELYNMNGEVLRTQNFSPQETSINFDLSRLPQGIYLMRIGNHTQRIVKGE